MTEPRISEFTTKQYRTLLLVLPIMLVVGLGLAVWAVYLAQFHVELLLRGQTTMGLVVGLESGTSSSASGRSAWFPVVRFETGDGRSVTFRHRTGSNPSNYSEGASVAVTYLPDSPKEALIAEGFRNWLLPGLLLVIGPGLVMVSLLGIAKTLKRLRQRNWIKLRYLEGFASEAHQRHPLRCAQLGRLATDAPAEGRRIMN